VVDRVPVGDSSVVRRPVHAPPASIVNLAPDRWTKPFWEASAEHRLVCAQCSECATFRCPPSPFCHICQSQGIFWVELSGYGQVYTYTVIRKALSPVFDEAVPFAVAVIELADAGGTRLVTNIVDSDIEAIRIGQRVHVVWDDIEVGVTVPRFALVREEEERGPR
jgi:uncharacterized protein